MQLTPDLLKECGANPAYVERYVDGLNRLLPKYGITTPIRLAHLLAQLLHESGGFRHAREIADGSAYEGRASLGNVKPGDGKRFRGRGLIQVTGRFNYAEISRVTGIDYLGNPEWLERPEDAVRSALWYWTSRSLSQFADTDNVEKITRRINGGLNGFADRKKYLLRCKIALGILPSKPL